MNRPGSRSALSALQAAELAGAKRQICWLEDELEQQLRDLAPEPPAPGVVAEGFFTFIAGHDGPPSAAHRSHLEGSDEDAFGLGETPQ